MSIAVAAGGAVGRHVMTVRVTAKGLEKGNAVLWLDLQELPSYTLTAASDMLAVVRGPSGQVALTLARKGGFNGPVTPALDGTVHAEGDRGVGRGAVHQERHSLGEASASRDAGAHRCGSARRHAYRARGDGNGHELMGAKGRIAPTPGGEGDYGADRNGNTQAAQTSPSSTRTRRVCGRPAWAAGRGRDLGGAGVG
jgi:hypothetical protein